MDSNILEINNLCKNYGKNMILDSVNIKVDRGDIYGLVGNNGAGKTTIMRAILGHILYDSGSIKLFGKEKANDIENVRRKVGALIEEPGFYPNLTAKQNLEYYRLQFGIPRKQTVYDVLEKVGLKDATNKKFKKFSMGMRQRLGIALSIMHSPELLVLDEPINGLDPSGIIEIRNLLLKLNRERNTTIIISSHILAELSNIATKYAFINKGKIVEEISSDELLKKCNEFLDIEVSDKENMSVVLEKELNITNFKVYPDNHIHIYGNLNNVSKINKIAVLNEIEIMSINKKYANIENYYMNLIGGNKND